MADLDACIKQDYMVKRSMMKSWLIKKENYKGRWFVLKRHCLCYHDGSLEVGFDSFAEIILQYVIMLQ